METDRLKGKPHIHVACAIIEREGRVLAAQRSVTMSLPLKWEFPGGKIDPGETPEDCLHRELCEELGITVTIHKALPSTTHHYPTFTITLYPMVCAMESGEISLREHEAVIWLDPEKLLSLDWAEADLPIIETHFAPRAS